MLNLLLNQDNLRHRGHLSLATEKLKMLLPVNKKIIDEFRGLFKFCSKSETVKQQLFSPKRHPTPKSEILSEYINSFVLREFLKSSEIHILQAFFSIKMGKTITSGNIFD
jgi:hypothetical protein